MRGALICRVDRKTASCAFYVSTRQAFGQILPISLPRRRIIGLLLYSGCQCGKSDRKILEGEARQGGSPFPRTKKAPAGARRRACLCPRHRDDEQRHTSPGAAGVFEGAAPPVLMVRVKGLEPIRRKAPDPKSGLSTNSNTPAGSAKVRICFDSAKWPMQKKQLRKGSCRRVGYGKSEAGASKRYR